MIIITTRKISLVIKQKTNPCLNKPTIGVSLKNLLAITEFRTLRLLIINMPMTVTDYEEDIVTDFLRDCPLDT